LAFLDIETLTLSRTTLKSESRFIASLPFWFQLKRQYGANNLRESRRLVTDFKQSDDICFSNRRTAFGRKNFLLWSNGDALSRAKNT